MTQPPLCWSVGNDWTVPASWNIYFDRQFTLMATNKNNPKQNASTSKRMRQEDTDDDVDIPKTTSWPRYLVMTGSDILKPLTNLSPFVLWKRCSRNR